MIAKMTGTLRELDESQLKPTLLEFVDIIDSYNVLFTLGDDDKAIKKEFCEHIIQGQVVQVVIGKNYRINLFADDTIKFYLTIRRIMYDQVIEYQNKLDEFGFQHKTNYTTDYNGLVLKSNIDIDLKDEDLTSKLMSMFDLFKLE